MFCSDQENCGRVAENMPCRHTDSARPSMSGFGIDATGLIISSGWAALEAKETGLSDKDAPSWVAGLILLA
ncbi:MAG: DUF2284 domain-containing protein [Proteobacteria bacterium]|nr:DUF2284 domain-containing protein [Pseudomonadota bacterium]